MITYSFGGPSHLYKYLAMPPKGDAEREARIRNILVSHNLFFSNPETFNDPYDCYPHVYAKVTTERAEAAIRRGLTREFPDRTAEEIDAQTAFLMKSFDPEAVPTDIFQGGVREAFEGFRLNFGVYCLSRRYDSVLMWSHYADRHTGFALRFDANDALIGEAIAVDYSSSRPTFDPGVPGEANLRNLVLAKARDWKYEEEYRIVRVGQPDKNQPFNPKALTGIVFGQRMPDRDKERLREWCAEGKLDVKFYQAIDDRQSFSVRMVDLG